MPTLYQLNIIKRFSIAAIALLFLIVLSGNFISYFFFKNVSVDKSSYEIIDGFPFFTSEDDYIQFIEKYPYNPGVEFKIYTVLQHDTIWKIRSKFNISIETLISANPHLKDFNIKPGNRLVISAEEGTLFAFDDYFDVKRMKKIFNHKYPVSGKYKPGLFKLISPDDLRLVFFKDAIPLVVNPDIENLYKYKLAFTSPLNTGFFTSMFGDRINPFSHEAGMQFHNGIDIATRTGTPIRAAREGMVFHAEWREGYGNTVFIQHHDGYTSMYAHCFKIFVKRGDWVKKGDIIASVGSTGRSTGPHLHYTIMRHGQAINPLKFVW
ncbi:MAG: peptidoglycan DD-metalloendopeptidase family protein [Spirochaetota bacterium]